MRILLSLVVMVTWALPQAEASVVYDTGFEPPDFVLGPLRGQDGWVGDPSVVGSVQDAVVESGTQAVVVVGNNNDLGRNFTVDPTEPIHVTFDWNLGDVTDPGGAWRVQFFAGGFLGGIQAFDSDSQLRIRGIGSDFGTGVIVPRNEWHEVELVLDLQAGTLTGFYDGVQVGPPQAFPPTSATTLNLSLRPAGQVPADESWLDDLNVENPEVLEPVPTMGEVARIVLLMAVVLSGAVLIRFRSA
ncbi:MAG: hypothetical protein AAF533_03775 [Acidobacteriota bacterium]